MMPRLRPSDFYAQGCHALSCSGGPPVMHASKRNIHNLNSVVETRLAAAFLGNYEYSPKMPAGVAILYHCVNNF